MKKCSKAEFLEEVVILQLNAQRCLINEHWVDRIGDHDAELWEKAHELHNKACEVLNLIMLRQENWPR